MYNVIIESKNFFTTCYMFKFISFCFNNQHLFACEQKENLVKCIMESAAAFVGIAVKQRKEPIAFENFITHRLGKYRSELQFDPLSNIFLIRNRFIATAISFFVGIYLWGYFFNMLSLCGFQYWWGAHILRRVYRTKDISPPLWSCSAHHVSDGDMFSGAWPRDL